MGSKMILSSAGRYDTKSIDTTDTIQFILSIDTQYQKGQYQYMCSHDLLVIFHFKWSVAAILMTL